MRISCLLLASALLVTACDDGDVTPPDDMPSVQPAEVIANYADLVYTNYQDAYDKAVAMQMVIDAFVAAPTASTMEAAKRAWLEARIPYGQSEVFRFQDGPIDRNGGPEGQLNAWPLDEVYIDYVDGDPTAGIINDPTIEISKAMLMDLNEGAMGDVFGQGDAFDAEKAISVGYHAVEFLLWGQDLDNAGPGSRPYTDFIEGGGTAENGERRGQYLSIVAEIIVDDLSGLVDEWSPGGAYRGEFLAMDDNMALTKMMDGMGILSKGELGAERMDVGLETLDQEDEHSCFSDNTHIDILMNATGIQNVYLGRYEWFDGPGLNDLIRDADPAMADNLDAAFVASIEAINAMPVPFDQAISQNGSPGWMAVNAAVNALFDQADLIVMGGAAIDLTVGVELPE